MGFVSEQLKASPTRRPGAADGVATWRRVFGAAATDKEDGFRRPPGQAPAPGGGYGRSAAASGNEAFKRMLSAFRSRAPGGWSDDRWEQTRHFVGIAYVAIHRCNEQMMQAEFQVFKKDDSHPDGKRPVTKLDPPDGEDRARLDIKPYDLVRLLERPNREDSFGDLMANWNLQMDLTGTALTWVVPNEFGTPYEMYSIPTASAIPQPATNPDYPEGYYRIQPVYPYGPFTSYPTPASAVGAAVPAEWMLRFKYPHPYLRYDGYSPLSALRQHLDQVESIDRSRWYSMKRTLNPSAVLNFEDTEGAQLLPEEEIERIRRDFENAVLGPENVGQLFVAAPGSRLEPWGARPVDMDYQSGWDQLTSFALGGFGVTKPAAGMVEDTSYSTLFATLKQLYWLTLEPKCYRISSKLTRFVAPYFGDDLIIEVRCRPINDHDIKMARLSFLGQGKALKKNEARRECELPLTQEAWGDQFFGDDPQAMMAAAMPGQPGAAGPAGAAAGAAPGQPGQPNGVPPGAAALVPGAAQGAPGALPPDGGEGNEDMEAMRPRPGDLGRGALGPRKSLNGRHKSLSIYGRMMEELEGRNGNGRH